jgi:hypothetical protein
LVKYTLAVKKNEIVKLKLYFCQIIDENVII